MGYPVVAHLGVNIDGPSVIYGTNIFRIISIYYQMWLPKEATAFAIRRTLCLTERTKAY